MNDREMLLLLGYKVVKEDVVSWRAIYPSGHRGFSYFTEEQVWRVLIEELHRGDGEATLG